MMNIVFDHNLDFVTIEQAGQVVYDSRADVPCDMAKFNQTHQKHKAEWEAKKLAWQEWDRQHPRPAGIMIYSPFDRGFDE
jgi:hypothetical protein